MGEAANDLEVEDTDEEKKRKRGEPSALDWAKAQSGDLVDTAARMLGLSEPKHRGGTYEPFKRTRALAGK